MGSREVHRKCEDVKFIRTCACMFGCFCDRVGIMEKYQKDFRRWAEVAERVESGERPEFVKVGAIYWCHLGVGVGSELVGKGEGFTRPVLVIGKISERMVLVIPVTSKEHRGGNYMEVVVVGMLERLALMHFAVIDVLRLGIFIDEISPMELGMVRKRFVKLLKRYFYEKE